MPVLNRFVPVAALWLVPMVSSHVAAAQSNEARSSGAASEESVDSAVGREGALVESDDDEGDAVDDEGAFVEDGSAVDAGSGDSDTMFLEQSDSGTGQERRLLDVYGFADFTYQNFIAGKDNQWRSLGSVGHSSFAVGNFNLYLSSRISERWRALGEVRFTYLPHGGQYFESDGSVTFDDTTVPDYTDLGRDTHVGSSKIERVWIEFNANQYFNVRAGQWLTPYGIWNVDHGSPVIITTQRPFAIGEQLFPERQTGLQVRGQVYLGASTLEYAATVSNGRGSFDEYRDFDGNKALGGRIAFKTQPFGDLVVGASIYGGRFVEVSQSTHVETGPDGLELDVDLHRDVEADELSYAADLQWSWEGLLVQSEIVANEVRYKEGARPGLMAPDPNARQPDFLRWGGYVLLGYRTRWFGIMPFSTLQHLNLTNTDMLPPITGCSYGLNIRPDPRVVLKVEYVAGILDGTGSVGYRDPVELLQAQVAWAF